MRRRRCLDLKCPKSNESTLCERRYFFYHALTKSTEKLVDILTMNNLVKAPEFLSRQTLVNLFVDFSTEPIASQIIDEGER